MASDPVPPSETPPPPPPPAVSGPSALAVWLQRSALPEKLLMGGGLGGVLLILIFLIVYGFIDWQGLLTLLGYIGSAAAGWFLVQAPPANRRTWVYVALVSAGVALLFALVWFFMTIRYMPFVVLLNAVAAVAAAVGAFLSARAEKLF
jgi:hypothetical protein